MGWVSQRHMNTSGGLNRNPSNNGSQKGPLRKRVQFIAESGSGMMKREKWLLECGHEAWGSYGANRMRCGKCKQSNNASTRTANVVPCDKHGIEYCPDCLPVVMKIRRR